MTRKIFFVAAMTVAALCGCSKKTAELSGTFGEDVQMQFSIPSPSVRSVGETNEDAVAFLQIFVFDKAGRIEASGYAADDELTLTCKTGVKDIYAIVNSNQITGIQTYSDLEKMTSDLAESQNGYFVMAGRRTDYEFLPDGGTVSIEVTRLPAKVMLSKVSTKFELDVYQSLPFEILSVYLLNVAGQRNYLAEFMSHSDLSSVDLWYHMRNKEENPLSMLKDDLSGVLINEAEPYETVHSFFCYPNDAQTDTSQEEWSPRRTRLVVEARLGDVVYYYPVTLPVIESNMQYNVQLEVTRPGSSDPDIPVSKYDATFNVTVAPWKGIDDVLETI